MNIKKSLFAALMAALAMPVMAGIGTANFRKARVNDMIDVRFDLVLDSLRLGRNQQLYVTPVVENGSNTVLLPSVLVNGRNMHYGYLRGTMPVSENYSSVAYEIQRTNGKPQSLQYSAQAPFKSWMYSNDTRIKLVIDSCGCGIPEGSDTPVSIPGDFNPAGKMRLVQITPEATAQPVRIHKGRARVQFEVDKTVLHTEPYRTQRGNQLIDNRAQLAMIDDSVRYALSDPNVEIESITVTGYASPESPYAHNDYLATNRSKALADHLAAHYSLPAGAARYGAVPENWGEFRDQVKNAKDITVEQRRDLLELIDRPAYGPADYDAKERELKTSPKFAKLYASTILPKWFPHLRATEFAISTKLKPMPDEKLAEIIKTEPEMLSLNQMYRVARLYPEGSHDFNSVIATTLKYYPSDPVANLNAAVTELRAGELSRAAALLEKAGDSPEAMNARGVLAARQGNFDEAASWFRKAGSLPEAVKNLQMLEE